MYSLVFGPLVLEFESFLRTVCYDTCKVTSILCNYRPVALYSAKKSSLFLIMHNFFFHIMIVFCISWRKITWAWPLPLGHGYKIYHSYLSQYVCCAKKNPKTIVLNKVNGFLGYHLKGLLGLAFFSPLDGKFSIFYA